MLRAEASLLLLASILAPWASAAPLDVAQEVGPAGVEVFADQRRSEDASWGANETELRARAQVTLADGTRADADVLLTQRDSWWRPFPAFEARDQHTLVGAGGGASAPSMERVGAGASWEQRAYEVNGVAVCGDDRLALVLHEGPLGSSRYERDGKCEVRFPMLP